MIEAIMDLSPSAFEEIKERFLNVGVPVGEHEGRPVVVIGTLAFRRESGGNGEGVRCYLVYQGKILRSDNGRDDSSNNSSNDGDINGDSETPEAV